MVSAYLLDPGRRQFGLDQLALDVFGYVTVKFEEVLSSSSAETFREVPIDAATKYACEDADIALRLCFHYDEPLKKLGLDVLEQQVENPLINVLSTMETAGILVDASVLRRQSTAIGERIERLRTEIFELSGETFNIDSPKQLAHILEVLGLKEVKKTKTGRALTSRCYKHLCRNTLSRLCSLRIVNW